MMVSNECIMFFYSIIIIFNLYLKKILSISICLSVYIFYGDFFLDLNRRLKSAEKLVSEEEEKKNFFL